MRALCPLGSNTWLCTTESRAPPLQGKTRSHSAGSRTSSSICASKVAGLVLLPKQALKLICSPAQCAKQNLASDSISWSPCSRGEMRTAKCRRWVATS